ncbi:MAG: DNA polymerase/3'-5' exonuclease PolX [Halodesulfurarchaeum sp.]
MSRNAEVASLLEEFADLLEARDVEYKPRAYRRAATNLRDYPDPVEDLAEEGPEAIQEIEGVGEAISEKILEYLETGAISELEEERERLPVDMAALTRVEGVGPKTVGDLYEALGVQTLDDLEEAARAGEIQEVKGFGPKTEQNILDNIAFAREAQERSLLGDSRPVADDVLGFLEGLDPVDSAEVAGSIRRWCETIGDVDVLVGTGDGESVTETVTSWERVDEVIEAGSTKASVRIGAMRVDLRMVDPAEFGSALQYFTGSRDHNIRLRQWALERDRKVNEYGVFDVSAVEDPDAGQRVGDRLASETEDSVYDALDLPWIPPELREDRGELDAAADGSLPSLLELDDIRGDLHTHTDWSDGASTIEEMIQGAIEQGYEILCISDHGEGPGVFGDNGLADAELREQVSEIRAAADEAAIEVLTGVEANIAADGTVGTTSDEVLADLDLVIASPHSALGGDVDQTDRLIAAIEHPHVDILGHPSGRLINRRPTMDFDARELGAAAAAHDVALEVNANPHRLDLWGSAVQAAIEEGATITINTDAHSPEEYGLIRYGVHTARRGWAEATDVLNTWPTSDITDFLH